MAGQRPAPPERSGAHFLHDRSLIRRLVRRSGAGPGSLVLDLGAGYGAITAALAGTGARVVAIERDPRLAQRLRRRFASQAGVRIAEADLRTVPWPGREFLVVANPPFAVTTALARRLLGDPSVPLAGAELILGWGAACWLTADRPRDEETAWWTARYEIRLVSRVAAAAFAPPPAASAAHVSVRPRPVIAAPGGQRALRGLLRAAWRDTSRPAELSLPGGTGAGADALRGAVRTAIGARTPAAELTAAQWHQVAALIAEASLRAAPVRTGRPPSQSAAARAGRRPLPPARTDRDPRPPPARGPRHTPPVNRAHRSRAHRSLTHRGRAAHTSRGRTAGSAVTMFL